MPDQQEGFLQDRLDGRRLPAGRAEGHADAHFSSAARDVIKPSKP